jgi:hypothetical protein
MQTGCTLTNDALIKKLEEWVCSLSRTGGRAWSLRVPVDPDHDPDMLILEACRRLKEATCQQEKK